MQKASGKNSHLPLNQHDFVKLSLGIVFRMDTDGNATVARRCAFSLLGDADAVAEPIEPMVPAKRREVSRA